MIITKETLNKTEEANNQEAKRKVEFAHVNAEVLQELRNEVPAFPPASEIEGVGLHDIKKYETPYSLHYKAVHNVDILYFLGPEDLKASIALGFKYCQDRNWRFIQVRPMFHDILQKPQSATEREKYMTA